MTVYRVAEPAARSRNRDAHRRGGHLAALSRPTGRRRGDVRRPRTGDLFLIDKQYPRRTRHRAAAFRRPPCDAPQIDEAHGEAIGFTANGASYVTIGEGVGAAVHRFTVRPPLRG